MRIPESKPKGPSKTVQPMSVSPKKVGIAPVVVQTGVVTVSTGRNGVPRIEGLPSPVKPKKRKNEPKSMHQEPHLNENHDQDLPQKNINISKNSDLKAVNKLEPVLEEPVAKKRKKNRNKKPQKQLDSTDTKEVTSQKPHTDTAISLSPSSIGNGTLQQHNILSEQNKMSEEIFNKYPVLKDELLVKKFMGVSMTNNQKGRIRQVLKEVFKGTDATILPDVIHNKLQTTLKANTNLSDTDLRKIRVLYNMLKLATEVQTHSSQIEKKVSKKKKKSSKRVKDSGEGNNEELGKPSDSKMGNKEELGNPNDSRTVNMEELGKPHDSKIGNMEELGKPNDSNMGNKEELGKSNDSKTGNKEELAKNKEKMEQKVKGPKRYVVFVGNLPLDVNKDMILDHFSDLRSFVKDVRIPPLGEGKKSAIAYVELENLSTFEMALSKHHSMLGSKRINVLYTTQQNSKLSKSEAKGKRAKLVAMVKSGQLAGSVPLVKKRSQRRAKQRRAMQLAEASNQ